VRKALGVLPVLLAVVAGCLEGTSARADDLPAAWPRTCQPAIDRVVGDLGTTDKARLRRVDRNDLSVLHHGRGTGIRNDFGLWGGNVARAEDCNRRLGRQGDPKDRHPDSISMPIVAQVWLAVAQPSHRPVVLG
jgi:hypothetical protein